MYEQRILVGVVVGFVYVGDHPKRSGLAFVLAVLFGAAAAFLYFRSSGRDTTA